MISSTACGPSAASPTTVISVLSLQDHPQPIPDNCVIIGQKHLNLHKTPPSSDSFDKAGVLILDSDIFWVLLGLRQSIDHLGHSAQKLLDLCLDLSVHQCLSIGNLCN